MKVKIKEEEFLVKYKEFITEDKYISKKNIKSFLFENKYLLDPIKSQLYHSNKTVEIIKIINNLEKFVDIHNDSFIKRKLIEEKEYFDNLFKGIDDNINLDPEQRIALLTEEDYSMVIAGAGSGKTTTMAAKVKYLVEKLKVDPSEIILISYTNKAIEELKIRINGQFKIPVEIKTFHKFGIDILKSNTDEPLKVLNNSYYIIADYFSKVLCQDNEKLKELLYFFVYYFDVPTSALKFKSLDDYHQYKKRNDYITLKSRLGDYNQQIIESRVKGKYTIKGEFLRSSEEVMIANFLYMHNIEYDYEKPYPYLNKGKTYFPDFTIYYGEKLYYLEHYGISESGFNRYYSKYNLYKYKKGMDYKAKLHHHYNTELITTFSLYNDGIDLIEHLKEELTKKGIILNVKCNKEIFETLVDTNKDIYYTRFIMFCMDFLKGFKRQGFEYDYFEVLLEIYNDDKRTSLFLQLMKGLYKYYDMELKINKLIDFEDMINDSYKLLKRIDKNKIDLNYKYIIIDEYQDISIQRFNLTKLISDISKAKVIAVGDDWQAIFAFAGSDVSLFTEFKNLMGYGEELQITNTYRNSQELIDIAGKFIMQNKFQIKKRLKAQKRLSKPVTIINYDDSYNRFKNKVQAIVQAINSIIEKYGEDKKILLIGRYNFDRYHLINSEDFYEYGEDKIKSVQYPNLDITFLTAHSSKGLGYDNVIIINGEQGIYGFPSQVKDDPIMETIKVRDNSYSFAEERRLFYVALTRTKNKVYIISSDNNPSQFLVELKNYENVEIVKSKNNDSSITKKCPICNYPLIKRSNNSMNIISLYECSNEKELCDFKTNNLIFKKRVTLCPNCKEGYIIVKKSLKTNKYYLGCTNYKTNNCGYIKSV